MAELFHLSVLTPTQSVLDEEVESIVVPGSEGYLGVLAHHAPLITAVVPGKFTVKRPGAPAVEYSVSGGFLEVSANHAILLADAIEPVREIDLDRAQRSLERARQRLRDRAQVDAERAQSALRRAENRVRIGTEMRRG